MYSLSARNKAAELKKEEDQSMHEFSTMQSIIQTVLRVAEQHKAEKVIEVNLEVGELTLLNPDQLRFAFETLTERTIVEDAVLNIRRVGPKIKCLKCGYKGEITYEGAEHHTLDASLLLNCPMCGGGDLELTSGRECNIKDVKVKLKSNRSEQNAQ